jgi:hypothetical protein
MVGKKTKDDMASCSILPAMAGIVPYENMSRAKVLSRAIRAKDGENVRDEFNPGPATKMAMELGDLFENVILERCVSTLGLLMPDYDVDYAVQHQDIPLQGSMDGFAFAGDKLRIEHDPAKGIYVMGSNLAEMSGKVILECKVTRDYPEEEPKLFRGPMQLQGLMDIEGAKWGVLCVLYQSTTLRMFIYHRDEVMVKEIHKMVKDFDRRVQNKDPYPPVNPSEALTIWQQEIVNTILVELPEEAEDQIELIELATESINKWTDIKKEATAKVMAMLEENPYGELWKDRQGQKVCYQVRWPVRHYKAQEKKVVPAKDAYSIRQKTLNIKEVVHENTE